VDAFVWNDHFATGIESVDVQHHRLVDMVNHVGDMLVNEAGATEGSVQEVFGMLAEYAQFHFADEERLMAENGLDPRGTEMHVGHHSDFIQQVGAMWQARASMQNPAEALHGFLSAWLTFHILGEDQAMARQIRRVGEGMTPAAAYELEREATDTPTEALLNALKNLYGVLALHNRDLAAANRDLEAKVLERTRSLLQAEKMASIGQLAAGVAHEINNPIGFVNSNFGALGHYVEELLRLADIGAATAEGAAIAAEVDLDFLRGDLQALLAESRDGLERVRRIVADLKDFSQVDAAAWQEVDLLASLETTLNVLGHEFAGKVEVVRELQPLPRVRCIAAQINQVLMNLLLNAAQALDGQGVLTLRSGVEGSGVWIEIADNGPGMDEKTRQRIFEPFFTTRPVGKGTGLGLSVTWDIVRNHGGTIAVTSAPGRGSVFRVWLPLAGADGAAAEA
jgi:hemerythrin-like metal-binding protein